MNRQPALKIRRQDLKDGECLCDYCSAKCCRYFALPIEAPQSAADLEYIRWYLLHEYASVFVEEDTWYILVHTRCRELQDDNRCGAYETRPQICRDYTTDECEYDDDHTYDSYFELPEQIHEYTQARFVDASVPEFRSPRPALNVIYNAS
ncbi:MAG: YkgJ family cysteine cluster protein [Planctomycetota bacterium]